MNQQNPVDGLPQGGQDMPTIDENKFNENFQGAEVPKEQAPITVRTMQDDVAVTKAKTASQTFSAADLETGEPVFRPETVNRMETVAEDEDNQGGKKKFIITIVVIIGVIALGAVGYFFIFPVLFPP